ncbi:hypothetical protein EON65_26840 [archaeon]|nr:MAG: hypothetical protein EON65_26840 [archaeon]
MKDIGQSGMKFLKKLMDTQMYSNYCQWNRSSVNPPTPALDGSVYRLPGSPMTGTPLNPLNSVNTIDPMSPSAMTVNSLGVVEEENPQERSVDSLVELFAIALSGTIPSDVSQVNLALDAYKLLYPETIPEVIQATLDYCNSIDLIRDITSRISRSSRTLRKYIDRKIYARYEMPQSDLSYRFKEEDFFACNGLLCQGYCNTSQCTEICVQIWENKVHVLRHKKAAFDIVSKKYEKAGKPKLQNADTSVDLSMSKIEYVTSSGVRLEAFKHGRETFSQYTLRKQVIASAIQFSIPNFKARDEDIDEYEHKQSYIEIKKPKKSSRLRYKERKVKGVLFSTKRTDVAVAEKKSGRQKVFAHTSNPYVLALARYFVKKESKFNNKYRKRCYQRIQRLCRKFVAHFRKVRYHRSVLYVQSIVRGYIVRNNLALLVDTLIDRKRSRLMASIRIRNFVRNHADNIIRLLDWKVEEKARKRRSQTSIPVSLNPVSPNSSTYNSVSGKELGIAGFDRHIPANSSAISIRSPRYLSEPSLENMHKAVVAASASVGKSSTGLPPTPKIAAENMDSMPRSVTESEAHPAMPNMNRRPSIGLSLPDKAREFLQFGKIVRKSPMGNMSFGSRSFIPSPVAAIPPLVPTQSTPIERERRPSLSASLSSMIVSATQTMSNSSSPISKERGGSNPESPEDNKKSPGRPPSPKFSESPPPPMSVQEDILAESRREMINAVMSPTSFPQIDGEYDDSGDESCKVLNRVMAFKKSRHNRFSRRFSVDHASTEDTEASVDAKAIQNASSKLSAKREFKSDSLMADKKMPFTLSKLDMTKVRPPPHIAKLLNRDELVDAKEYSDSGQSDRDEKMSVRSSSHHTIGNCTTTTGVASGASHDERSDEETVFSNTTATTTNTARAKRSTPLGRFAAANNYAIHNMVNSGSRTSRSSTAASPHHSNQSSSLSQVPDSFESKSSDNSIRVTNVIPAKRFSIVPDQTVGRPLARSLSDRNRRATIGGGLLDNASPTEAMIKNSSQSVMPREDSPTSPRMRRSTMAGSPDTDNQNSSVHLHIASAGSTGSPLNYATPAIDGRSSPVPNFSLSPEIGKPGVGSPKPTARKSIIDVLTPMSSPKGPPINTSTATAVAVNDKSTRDENSKPKVELLTSEVDSGDDEALESMSVSNRRECDDMVTELRSYPLKAFGFAAADLLNRQQIAIIKKMYGILRAGLLVTKHNRSGAPKTRRLFIDLACSKLYWRAPTAKADKEERDEDNDSNDETALLSPAHPPHQNGGFHLGSFLGRMRGRRSSVGGDGKVVLLREIISVSYSFLIEFIKTYEFYLM